MKEEIVSTADDQELAEQMIRVAIKGGLLDKATGEKMIAMNRTIGDVTLSEDGTVRYDRVKTADGGKTA